MHNRLAMRVPLVEKTVQSGTSKEKLLSQDNNDGYPRVATMLLMEAENAFMAGDRSQRIFEDSNHNLKLSFRYQPSWHVKQGVIGTYFSTAYFQEGDEIRVSETAFRQRQGDDINALIDRCHLRRALHDIEALRDQSASFVGIPVHFSTLRHTAHRQTFQYLLHSMPDWCRELLVWEILDTPADAMRTHIEDISSLLRPFCRYQKWRMKVSKPSIELMKGLPLVCAGFSVEDLQKNEAEIMSMIDSWVNLASAVGLKTYLLGVNTRSLSVAAASAGVDYISGEAIGEPVDELKGFELFSEDQLYTKILSDAFKE